MSGRDWRAFGRIHAKLYQCLGGRLVGNIGFGRKVLVLTTTGRKTGLPRTTALAYLPLDERAIVYPSNGGLESPPAWWLNLQANPEASIQIGNESHPVRARRATDAEYEALWPKAAAYNSHWASYEQTVNRPIPLVILERVDV